MLRDLVPSVQFKKHEEHPRRNVSFIKVTLLHSFSRFFTRQMVPNHTKHHKCISNHCWPPILANISIMKESFKTARKGLVVTRESILPWSNIIWLSWVGGGGIKIMNDCDILVDMKFSLPKVYQQKISLIPSIYVEIPDLFNKQNLILKEMLTDLLSTNKQTRKRNKVHW